MVKAYLLGRFLDFFTAALDVFAHATDGVAGGQVQGKSGGDGDE
jgi:hypothetical protein